MKTETPLIEYLIIGTHTSLWLVLLLGKAFGFGLAEISQIDPAVVVVFLPIIYILGMLFDDITFQYYLDKKRKTLKEKIYDSKKYQDEILAYSSSELYTAYESRVRRIRVIGASIFNWPLLGLAIVVQIGFSNWLQVVIIIITSIALSRFSYATWESLYRRAYKFRKNACDVVFKHESQPVNAAK